MRQATGRGAGSLIEAYDPARRGTAAAVPASGGLTTATNANGPINEAEGAFTLYNLASNPIIGAQWGAHHAAGDLEDGREEGE